MPEKLASFKVRTTTGSKVEQPNPEVWRLTIPSGIGAGYRCAQLDDYGAAARAIFKWQPPVRLTCSARVSHPELSGTWGFGFWNDPFTANLRIKGGGFRLPALPNAAWFFHASPENRLSLRPSHPANGLMAAAFRSPLIPSLALTPGYPFLPLALVPPLVRLALPLAARIVRQNLTRIAIDHTAWNNYCLELLPDRTVFSVNGIRVFETPFTPRGRLGALVWIDNQYAAIHGNGTIQAGTLENKEPAWMEIKEWEITTQE